MPAERTVPSETRPTVRHERTADVLIDILVRAGTRVVFGLPGGAISPLYDALLDRPEIRVINMRHESGAMFAAAAYARTTGQIGVVLVTSGPGVTNAMTGLASAYCDGLPVLVFAGEVSRQSYGKNALQEGSAYTLNMVGMARSITKLALEVPAPEAAPGILHRAMATALTGRRGPVLLTLPLDVATSPIRAPRIAVAQTAEPGPTSPLIDEAASALYFAKRPVLFAGAGTRWGDGSGQLRRLAEQLQIPVMTTPKGKGVFPESHPLSLGVFGIGGHPSTTRYLEEGVDVLLAVGTGLSEVATNGWSDLLRASHHFIQIDADASQLGRSYPVTFGLVGQADQLLAQMARALPDKRPGPRRYGVDLHDNPEHASGTLPARVAPQRALWELQKVMPANTVYTCDIGEHLLFAIHYLKIDDPDGFVVMTGLGSMGSSIGAAIGFKLARPDRPVVAICGDGCFSMALGELATAVQEQIPIVVVVLNDRRYGMVEIGHEAVYGRKPHFSWSQLSVFDLARGAGAECIRIQHLQDLLDLDPSFGIHRGPLVIDVQIDDCVRMPQNSRNKFLQTATQHNAIPQ